jgi:hypothetical protein
VWQVKALCILNLGVPASKAISWLESLPDDEAFIAHSMTAPATDLGATMGLYQTCWIALAHEKVGLYEGALRFADLQLEPDMLKGGGLFERWPHVMALACKGRVFARLHRPDEALAAFPSLKVIWMQIGVEHAEAAQKAQARGVDVVQNKCPKIEYQRLFGELRFGGFNTGIISSKL